MAFRFRLFTKYAAFIVALVGGALIVSGGTSLYFAFGENKQSLFALQREKADAAAYRIEQYVRTIEHELGWTALPRVLEGTSAAEQRRIEFLKLLRQAPQITEAVWIDRSGREQVRVSRLAMDALGTDANLSNDPRVVGSKNGKTWFGPVTFRKDTEPYMGIARAAGGAEGGTTAVEVNLKFVWDVVSQMKVGQSGIAYVVDAEGHLVAHPDISLVLQKLDWTTLAQVKAALESNTAEDTRQIEAKSRDGKDVLAAFATIPSLGWRVMLEVPRAEIIDSLQASAYRTLIILLIGLVLSMLAALFLARTMVRPIRALQEGAEQIGAGNLDHTIDIKTGDELETLANQFNTMAHDLKESYAGLERKVDDRTRELTETLDQQTATAEILRVISSSPTNVQPVFDAIVGSAVRLFNGRAALLLVKDGKIYMGARGGADLPDQDAIDRGYPIPLDRNTVVGQAILDQKLMQVADFEAPDLPANIAARGKLFQMRAVSFAPLIRDGVAIGAISVPRTEPGVLTDSQMALLKTFADQAVIAIENVRLFNEIEDKSRQLELANKHKSEFLANMSHELRTPLNAIIGFSEVLIERMFGDVNDKQEEYLKDIHTSGQHLLSLINDILDLSKVEAGRMELNLANFHLPSAIDNALTLIRERAQRNNVTLKSTFDPALLEISADERKLKQILLNLLSNAVKFTPEGGSITVTAGMREGMVEIAVTDTGVGIAETDLAAVFEEFKQVGTDYTRKAEGTGLGLPLAKRFVELHGGTMRLESEIGKGSTFIFTLPLSQEGRALEGQAAAAGATHSGATAVVPA